MGLLETSRGCGYHCLFCFQGMYGRKRRLRSLSLVVSDLERVIAWGAKSLYFMDLEFTLDRERILELCGRMASRKISITWCCQTRADHVDAELLSKMRAAGCRLIHFGLETANSRLLERIGKGMTPDRAVEAVRLCREAGIETAGFFLFGLPGETARDRQATVRLALALGLGYASFHVAAPYPGTRMGGSGVDRPCLEEHHIGLLARDVRRALLRFYLRPSYLAGHLRSRGWKNLWSGLRLWGEFIR